MLRSFVNLNTVDTLSKQFDIAKIKLDGLIALLILSKSISNIGCCKLNKGLVLTPSNLLDIITAGMAE